MKQPKTTHCMINDGMTVALCDLATGEAGETGNWTRAEALAECADMIATGRTVAS